MVPLTAPVLAPGVDANSDKLFVVLTFSGGGKRAAAFSYGVLEALRDVNVTTPDGEQHSLLDEIDLISAVSGGAFTAAYYALNGQETFDSYAPRFLNHDTEKDLWHKVLAPVELAAPRRDRGEPQRSRSRILRRGAVQRRHGARRHDALAARDHHGHRPGARQAFRVHARAAQWHLRGSEERAGGARGVRLGRHAYLFRAAGDAQFRGAMRLPATRHASTTRPATTRTSTGANAPSACCRSSTARTTLTCTSPMARSPTTSARAPSSTRWRSAKQSPTRCGATASRARAACCSSWSTRARASIAQLRATPRAARHQEGHGRGGQRHLQPLQLRDHEPAARSA